ncbi:MAG TPA: molybdenum cofactor biosynthesis protein B [Longimicrobiaceae bacterium]|nr:molybdenum cofactor biosynthesis protein B [Longimicrobiaceae bacterium]
MPSSSSSSSSSSAHRSAAADRGPIAVAVVTVSDSRTPETDVNGHYLREEIERAGHELAGYRIVKDEPDQVAEALDEMAGRARIVIFNGGTGISSRDTTYDAIAGRLGKVLPGFGELFRMLSWEQVGSAAMLSRATAGVYGPAVVFSTPGSPAAVRLAWEKLIRPELHHLAWELGR